MDDPRPDRTIINCEGGDPRSGDIPSIPSPQASFRIGKHFGPKISIEEGRRKIPGSGNSDPVPVVYLVGKGNVEEGRWP